MIFDSSDSDSAVSDVILLKAVKVPYLMWLPGMCSKLCVLENKTFMNRMAHSSMRLPLHRVSCQLPFTCVLFPFPIVDCAFAGIAWKHKDTCWLLGSKAADVLAEISDPKSSGGSVGLLLVVMASTNTPRDRGNRVWLTFSLAAV